MMQRALAPAIMVQGTSSSAGKSLLVTALCRIFHKAGLSVAPFKSQNMALNSAVTVDGLEIGRAQAVQAKAAGIEATVDMNPILLKPEAERRSQVIVLGKVMASMGAVEYQEYKPKLRPIVAESLFRLRSTHDLIVIEGAGSPAEINLKAGDLVNMYVAGLANAPVLLVGDIDRGGVFASFVGTLELLDPAERSRIAGFVVNKFRGDLALLQPGLDFLTARTGVPVAGVLPYISQLRLPDEDSLSLDSRIGRRRGRNDEIDICVIRTPRISNYDDIQPLEHEAGVVVRFVTEPSEAEEADLLILAGSKNTVADLAWLRESGFSNLIYARAARRQHILGLCGGCQMLGQSIEDPHGVESTERRVEGLKLLPLKTRFETTKVTAQVRFRTRRDSFVCGAGLEDMFGYEIHMGNMEYTDQTEAPFEVALRNGSSEKSCDGALDSGGAVFGTMIHGLFENAAVRRSLIASLRKNKGLGEIPGQPSIPSQESEFDRLAEVVEAHLDFTLIRKLAGVESKSVGHVLR
jgi:adenosylcobyric acid synthase